MKLSVNWLKEILPSLKASAPQIADELARVGFEIESTATVENDTILELALPANRGDVLSHYGIAVEVAALFKLKPPVWPVSKLKGQPLPKSFKVAIKDKKGCLRYVSRLVKGVKVGPSPQWLRERLESIGLRPINNVVDATNYVMMELGHPLHAFDARQIRGNKIEIRQIGQIADFVTLDKEKRRLEPDDLVIADAEGPVALAGIIGGENSQIQNDTTDVVLEAAAFHPDRIRKTARRLGIHTDSSHRFERFVNPATVALAMDRLTEILLKAAGGEASQAIDFYPLPAKPKTILLRTEKLQGMIGFPIAPRDASRILSSLGLTVKAAGKNFKVTIPTGRADLEREIDLIEEVVRYVGFDRIPSIAPPTTHRPIYESAESRHGEEVRRLFASFGFWETVHYSFTSPDELTKLGFNPDELPKLKNPISADLSVMRPTLLGGLLKTLQVSLKEKPDGGRFFEIRTVFSSDNTNEKRRLTAVYCGNDKPAQWKTSQDRSDFYTGKGIVEELISLARIRTEWEKKENPWTHPGQTLNLMTSDGQLLGYLGRLHPDLLARFDLPKEVFVIDLDYSLLAALWKNEPPAFSSYSPYPRVERDMALVVDKSLAFKDVKEAIEKEETVGLREIQIFDVYEGDKMPEGKKSMGVKLIFENFSRTLTDEEVNAAHFALIDRLKTKLGAILR